MKTTAVSKSAVFKFVFRIALPVLVTAACYAGLQGCAETVIPNADFEASSTAINAGQSVNFTDQSDGRGLTLKTWLWTFSGGTPNTSTEQNPTGIVYPSAGSFAVSLKVTTYDGEDTETKSDYITVTATPALPVAAFSASDTLILSGGTVDFTDQSTGVPTSWEWTFEGGTPNTSTDQNPTGISYAAEGTFDVTLIATNAIGNDTEAKVDYITVTQAPFCVPVTDIDGNVYQVVDLAGSCWMKSNLKTSTYDNGMSISFGLDSAAWTDNTTGAYTLYDNNLANDATYGKLYNWHAINSSNGICPEGWHPATKAEWLALIASQGGETLAGGALRSTTGWDAPNTGATNSSDFSALPGGFLTASYDYSALGTQAYFWTSTSTGTNLASYLLFHNGSADLFNYDLPYNAGLSCRCVKD